MQYVVVLGSVGCRRRPAHLSLFFPWKPPGFMFEVILLCVVRRISALVWHFCILGGIGWFDGWRQGAGTAYPTLTRGVSSLIWMFAVTVTEARRHTPIYSCLHWCLTKPVLVPVQVRFCFNAWDIIHLLLILLVHTLCVTVKSLVSNQISCIMSRLDEILADKREALHKLTILCTRNGWCLPTPNKVTKFTHPSPFLFSPSLPLIIHF